MSCSTCSQNLEETDLMSELPWCGLVMHSKCALKLVADGSYSAVSVFCPGCDETIWSHPLYTPEMEPLIPEACLNELKTMKTQIKIFKKSFSTFRKKVTGEKRQFRDQIKPNIDAIRSARNEKKNAIKASSEHAEYKTIYRVFMKQMKRLSVKYDIPMRVLLNNEKLSYWGTNALHYINRLFYIRI